ADLSIAFFKLYKFDGGAWGRVYSRAPRKISIAGSFAIRARRAASKKGTTHAEFVFLTIVEKRGYCMAHQYSHHINIHDCVRAGSAPRPCQSPRNDFVTIN